FSSRRRHTRFHVTGVQTCALPICHNDSKVAFVDILDEEGAALAAETGATFIRCDITDTPALVAAIDRTRDALGLIGVLVNNAAKIGRASCRESAEVWAVGVAQQQQ